ncbi:DNA-binding response regulator [Burkholderia multivorans]|uniref:response regulator transcription factor n=2 Tax=Burkholderia multivorans TaxID=87883 RepID=UPI000D0097D9|nr:response regulator transcription factor [Burkholderia multivorans]MBU9297930.1 response regulator transcription factor [Burkholderia multivorans]MBU9340919.1 response regulator transcription factor [Burkholderia multivorans]PRD78245.1 DNA-binding response regulator [Burkholderia multivorans]QGR64139.1 response regulator [Burkholderia multivorans]
MNELRIGVVLADDHPGMIVGVSHELSRMKEIELRGHAANSTELVELLETTPCDVLVSDYAMPGGQYGDGIALFSFIRRRFPDVKLVVLTMLDNAAILGALDDIGVRAIVSKADAVSYLFPAILTAHAGDLKFHSPTVSDVLKKREARLAKPNAKSELSLRETEVVRMFVSGMRVDDIAEKLNRSKKTVSTHKARAMEKLGIKSDTDLIKYAVEHGWETSSRARPDQDA